MPYVKPRFGLVFEFDRRGGVPGGTKDQQTFIREVVVEHAYFGSLFLNDVIHPLAVAVKKQVPYLRLGFAPDMGLGSANQWAITMWAGLQPGEQLESVFLHELGHVVAFNLFNPISNSEGWAEDFRAWVQNGCDPTSYVYRSIKAGQLLS